MLPQGSIPLDYAGPDLAYSPISSPLSAVIDIPSFPTLPATPPSRVSATMPTTPADDSDADAEGESDNEGEDSDEYVPNTLRPPRQRRSYQNAYNSASSSRSISLSTGPYPSPASTCLSLSPLSSSDDLPDAAGSRVTRHAPRRTQVGGSPEPLGRGTNKNSSKYWGCPHCNYLQKNRRQPDLRRHIDSHFRDRKKYKFVCCGFPVTEASQYRVPADKPIEVVRGVEMTGGCFQEFSRKDALARHMKNSKQCMGDLKGHWHPYNQGDNKQSEMSKAT